MRCIWYPTLACIPAFGAHAKESVAGISIALLCALQLL
jgi:hypothetical protein